MNLNLQFFASFSYTDSADAARTTLAYAFRI